MQRSRGYIQAALAISFYQPPDSYRVEQTHCLSRGDAENRYEATLVTDFASIPSSPGLGVTIKDASERNPIPTQVNENGITEHVRGVPFEGNSDGLIPAFGVYLTRHFANYFNYISYEAAHEITRVTGEPELARDLFIEAGHFCAFHTFGGIMESDEWYGLVEPQCQTREDWLSGVIAISNALGYGYLSVTELQPGERMVMRVDGSYESNGYLGMYGKSDLPRSYIMTGAAAGLMNLLYFGDITDRPELNEAHYDRLFRSEGSFVGRQVRCRSMGDTHCEIEVTKAS